MVSASGGDGACVAHCHLCDRERRCLQCADGYYWVGYNCVPSCASHNNQCCDRNRFVATCAVDATSSASECNAVRSNCYSIRWAKWKWEYYCGYVGRYCSSETNPSIMVSKKIFLHTSRDSKILEIQIKFPQPT